MTTLFIYVFICIYTFIFLRSERTTSFGTAPLTIIKSKSWDGKDASPPVEAAIEGVYDDEKVADNEEIEIV